MSLTSVNKRINIKLVAQEAGVSTQTVSRVINNHPYVSEATRKRVEKVIQELGYKPSSIARSLIQQRSYTIGVLITNLVNIGFVQVLSGISRQAESQGYAVLLRNLQGDSPKEISKALDFMATRRVDGIVCAFGENTSTDIALYAKHFKQLSVPVVFVSNTTSEKYTTISIDNFSGGKILTNHLLAQGYRNIGYLSGPLNYHVAQQRKAGWEQALHAAGIGVTDRHFSEANWSGDDNEPAMEKLLENYPEMDAVFVANITLAGHLYYYATKRGLRMPQDLAIVAMAYLPPSTDVLPFLTIARQDFHTVGMAAATEVIQASVTAKDYVVKHIRIQPELIVRESSSPKSQK